MHWFQAAAETVRIEDEVGWGEPKWGLAQRNSYLGGAAQGTSTLGCPQWPVARRDRLEFYFQMALG